MKVDQLPQPRGNQIEYIQQGAAYANNLNIEVHTSMVHSACIRYQGYGPLYLSLGKLFAAFG